MAAADVLTWLVETTLATSALILLVLIIRRPVARRFGAEAAYLLWLAPALRFVAPEFAVLPAPAAASAETSFASAFVGAASATPATALPAQTVDGVSVPVVLVLWATGAIVFAAWQFGAQIAFSRRLRAISVPAPEAVRAEAATVAWRRGFRRKFELRIASDETGPLVAGLFRPVVVVPASFVSRLSSHERQMALAHEFAHIARGDLYAACAATLLRALQWFNPLAHAAWRAFRGDQEAACDALVLRRAADSPNAAKVYAEALVKSARGAAPACALSIAFNLKERLVLMKTTTTTRPALARAVALLAVASSVAMTASYSYADEKADGEKPKTVEIKRVMMVGEGKSASTVNTDEHVMMVRSVSDAEGGKAGPAGAPNIIFMNGGGDAKSFSFVSKDGPIAIDGDNCKDENGKPVKALIDEKSEAADGDKKFAHRTIICSVGSAKADPKKEAEALRMALARMQDEAKREAEVRAKTIAAIEARIAELEKKSK
jgi:beta-lactamase regulating signal transducer with metallopeptidase domain